MARPRRALDLGEGVVHNPKQVRDHVAQEYRAKGDVDTANELVRRLPLRHKAAVLPEGWAR